MDSLPAVMRPNGGDEHAGVVPRLPGVRAEPRPAPKVEGEPRRVMEGLMAEETVGVVKPLVRDKEFRVVEAVEVMMVEAVATA
jgi:hypothetical protein